MQDSVYLGTEKVGRLLGEFAIPCIFSLIISCLYNIVDQIFVGNGVGYLGNAATGVVFPVTVVGWGVSLFFGDGAAAALSVSLGRGETEDIHKIVANAILGSFLGGVAIIAIGYTWGDGLLQLIGATGQNLSLAHDYGFIIYAMMPLALVQNTLASIIRADGSPQYAMGAMLVGAVLNIIGDPVAIFVLGMGIKGAAWATILGQFVSFLICAAYLARSKTFRICGGSFKLRAKILRQVMALGTSSFLTQLSIVVITVINNILLVQYGARSEYGADIPLAAFVVIMKLFQIVLNIAIGIAAGAQPIVGYNYGAKKYARVRELLKLMIKCTVIVCLICTVLFETFPLVFIQMFGADGELYTQFAVLCLRIYLSLILFTCVQKVCAIFLQSIGHAKAAAPLSILRDLLLIAFSLVIPIFTGVTGIFWAAPTADVLAILITAAVMGKLWKELNVPDENVQESRTALKASRPGPIITIAREHGSAGKRAGQLVAERLGVSCYYKELTALAAQESGLAKEFISGLNADENAIMRDLYLSTSAVQQAITAQEKAIRMIADQGSCVIVGRAADYVLRERENLVRVFIHAPKDYRIKKVMEMYGDTVQEGEKSIARSDAARSAYYKSISGQDWGDPHHYELSVDSSIGAERAAEVIYKYLG
ncbi:MATE family efflux transporter [Acutalibacter intestini]|uniref:MATE family efflux transporter n=1 Tax=Acutalibacter intestini TaxID=3093659 RepID=UPI002AC9618F|nr:MATE family efflux transporter [Acutalibacter sp. M00204]